MRIIIVGGGVVGFSLAEHLLREGHNLTLIERNDKRCGQISDKLDMQIITGNGARPRALKEAGIDGVFALGNTSQPLCQIHVGLNRVGVIQLGGLNPVAAAVEAGIEIENVAESGLIDFERLHSVWEL